MSLQSLKGDLHHGEVPCPRLSSERRLRLVLRTGSTPAGTQARGAGVASQKCPGRHQATG